MPSAPTFVPSAPAASVVHLKKIEINQEGRYDELNIIFSGNLQLSSGLGMRSRGREHLDLVEKPHSYHTTKPKQSLHRQIHAPSASVNIRGLCGPIRKESR